MDFEQFKKIVTSQSIDIRDKEDALRECRTFVKQHAINSSREYVSFFKILQYVFGADQNEKLKSLAITIIGRLVKKLSSLCDDNESLVVDSYNAILPFLIENMAHLKSEYRKILNTCVIDLWLAIPSKIEYFIRDYLLANLNDIKRIFVLNELLKIIALFCRNKPRTDLTIYYVGLIRLFQFSSFSRSPVNVSINELSRQLLLFSISQSAQKKANFLEVANGCGITQNALQTILDTDTSSNILIDEDEEQKKTQVLLDSQDQDPFTYYKFNQGPSGQSDSVPDVNHEKTVDTQDISQRLDTILHSSSSFKLELIAPLEFNSISALVSSASMVERDFEGRETEFNWSKREKHIAKLRAIIRSDILQQSDDNQKEFLEYFKAHLLNGVHKAINSLRTTLSTNGCKFMKELFQLLNISNFEPAMVELIFKNVIKLTATTKKINNNNANAVIYAVLEQVYSLKHFNFRILNLIYDYSADKSLSPRIFSGNWLSIIILKHPTGLERVTDANTLSVHEGNALKLMEHMIEKGLCDPNPLVREQLRKTFWLLYRYYPNGCADLYIKLPANVAKLLDRAKPKDVSSDALSQSEKTNSFAAKPRPASVTSFRTMRDKQNRHSANEKTSYRPVVKSRSVSELSSRLPSAVSSSQEAFNRFSGSAGSFGDSLKVFGIGKPVRLSRKPTYHKTNENTETKPLAKPPPFANEYSFGKKNELLSDRSDRFRSIRQAASVDQNDDASSVTSSREDTDTEINTSMANKLVLGESKEEAANNNKKENLLELDKIIVNLKSGKRSAHEGTNSLIQLIDSGYMFSMTEHALLSSTLHSVADSNPSFLFGFLYNDVMTKIIDFVAIDDWIEIALSRQQSDEFLFTSFDNLVELLTFDKVIEHLLKHIGEKKNRVKYGLAVLKHLIFNSNMNKKSSSFLLLLDNILTSLILIWQEGCQDSLVKDILQLISRKYAKSFNGFINNTFDETGESQVVSIHVTKAVLFSFIGKSQNWHKVAQPEGSNKSLTSNWDVTLSENATSQPAIELKEETKQNFSGYQELKKLFADKAKNGNSAGSSERKISFLENHNNGKDNRIVEDEMFDISFGISPVKISDLNKPDDVQDAHMNNNSDSEIDNVEEMTKIVPPFLKTQIKTLEAEEKHFSSSPKTLKAREENVPSVLNSAEAVKINKLIETVDPLKSIDKSRYKVAIYEDGYSFSGVYDRLVDHQVEKHRLISLKDQGVYRLNQREELENEVFNKVSLSRFKSIIREFDIINGKDASLVIFMLHHIMVELQGKGNLTSVCSWVVSKEGYNEIYNAMIRYIDSKLPSIDWNVEDVLMIFRLMVSISNLENHSLFTVKHMKKYWGTSTRILNAVAANKDTKLEETCVALMETILDVISASGIEAPLLLKILSQPLMDGQNGKRSSEVHIKYYLTGVAKALIGSVKTFDVERDYTVLSTVENNLVTSINSVKSEIRRESVLVYAIIYKIEQTRHSGKLLQEYTTLDATQQRLIKYYSDYI